MLRTHCYNRNLFPDTCLVFRADAHFRRSVFRRSRGFDLELSTDYIGTEICNFGSLQITVYVSISGLNRKEYTVAQLIEALRYKPEGRGFDPTDPSSRAV